jgi:hypothetical protein
MATANRGGVNCDLVVGCSGRAPYTAAAADNSSFALHTSRRQDPSLRTDVCGFILVDFDEPG